MRTRSVVVAVGLGLYGMCASTGADAAVLCRNKKDVVVVRDDACKKKEVAVDLTQFVPTTTTVVSTTTSTTLGYVFIDGNTFSGDAGLGGMARQVVGCVNQIPLAGTLTAPLHLPQGATVVSMTLFTFDNTASTTVGQAGLLQNDGAGGTGYLAVVASQPNTTGFQQNDSAPLSAKVDNATESYEIEWRKVGDTDSPILGVCGVRVAYQPPAAP